MGIISGAMAGFGKGLSEVAAFGLSHVSRSMLLKETAEIQRLRDERLEQIRRAPGKAAAAEIDAAREDFVDDPSGTVRSRTPSEMAQAEISAYGKQGLVAESMQARQIEMQRERDSQATMGRSRDDERAERQLDLTAQDRERDDARADRQLELSVKTFNVNAKGADLDRQIKKITLGNAQRLEKLRTEFTSATPERKAQIQDEVRMLTGKDDENFLPVPIKDEFGSITGYKIFDKNRGRFLDDSGGGGGDDPLGIRSPKNPQPAKADTDKPKPKLPGDRNVSQEDRSREAIKKYSPKTKNQNQSAVEDLDLWLRGDPDEEERKRRLRSLVK